MTKPSSKTQFHFAVKDLESKKWDFMGWKKKANWRWFIEKTFAGQLALVIETKSGKLFYFDLATVLCSLSARKLWFGEGNIKEWRKKGCVTRDGFIFDCSQQMILKGEPVQMLNWLVKFLKGKKC